MSMIDKLQILGVRSFDNKKSEIIQFYRPLTLIVGLNGSGKTTIIECLRYATTGELPPNSQTGGAWIHDTKLAGENEVLAQVRLSFHGVNGTRYVASRNIQVTVKKTTKSQKALDSTLMSIQHGERRTVSTRVADLDSMIPLNLGVSKAILESVIFCHQDDSLWPMSTPAILKKKFDEIFDAQKYTKAVDNIKLVKKNLDTQKKVLDEREKGARRDKDRAVDSENKQSKLQEEIEQLRDQQAALEEQIEEAQEASTRAYNQAAQVEKIVVELRGKRIELEHSEKTINALRGNMREMSDSDAALQNMLEQYEDRLAHNERNKEKLTKDYRDLAQQIQQNRDALGEKQSELGSLRSQKQRYEEQISNRKELVKDTARKHGIRGFDLDITNDHVRDFMEKISRTAREQQNAFDRARKETYDESHGAQQELNTLNGRKSELTQTKASTNSYIQQNDAKIVRYQKELDKIEVDEGSKAVLESNLGDLERRLSQSKEEFAKAAYESQIQTAESDIRALDAEKEKADAELREASRHAKDTARLDLYHKDLKDRKQGLETVTGAHDDRISKLLQSEWDPSNLEQIYQTISSEKNNAVKEAEMQRDGVMRESDHAKYKLSEAKTSLQRKEAEYADHEEAISDVTRQEQFEARDFPKVLKKAEDDVEEELSDSSKYEAMLDWWKESKTALLEENKCKMCRRPYAAEDAAKAKFLKRIENAITKAVDSAKGEELQERQERLQKVKEVRPRYDAWVLLGGQLPKLRSEVKALQAQLEACDRQLEQRDQNIKERQEAKREVEAISKTVQSIVKYHGEIAGFESQIKQLAASQQSFSASRGLEQIQDDQKAIADRSRAATVNLQQVRAAKDRAQTDITSSEFQVRDLRAQLSTTLAQLKERTQLHNQVDEINALNVEQRNVLKTADQELQTLGPKIAQVQARLEDIRTRGDERDRALQKEVAKINDSINQLKIAEQEINAYVDRGGPQRLARAEREIGTFGEEISRFEEDQRGIAVQIKKLETELANHNETKRAITDNITYRQAVKQREDLEQVVSELESHNAEADAERYNREGKHWSDERNKLGAQQAHVVGEMKSKDDQLLQLLNEYETHYQDANELWRKAKIELVVTGAAIGDLSRYGGALDQAIMKYHSIKMEEINRIIDELWRNTYQGTDVDTIMIKSESETQQKNKSYNYRVVMIKQDAEMDMRGRCSAGQKVLASIIIRLALAECFGVRCGLIALDEPTTNLDRDNIIALAGSLSEIIKNRRQQSNFQLIVITHDEEFLKSMNCADYTDYYYRVGRDANMCSEIKKQNIANVSATQTDNEWKITTFED